MHALRHTRQCLMLTGIFLVVLTLLPAPARAQTINIRIGPPPAYRFAAPPPVVVIPGTYVYAVPDIATEIYFFSGYWYRLHEGHWFRGRSYNGPWTYWPDNRVPPSLFRLPPGHRNVPPGHRRIPQGELKRNWAKWERNRHWDKDPQWRGGWEKHGPGPGYAEDRPGPGPARPQGGPGGPPQNGPGRPHGGPGGPHR